MNGFPIESARLFTAALYDLALFHHEGNTLGRGDVGSRITRHCNDIGDLTFLQRADLGRDPEQVGIDRGPGTKRFDRPAFQDRPSI